MKKFSLMLFVMLLSMVLFGCQQSGEVQNNPDNNNSKQDEDIENVQKIEGYILTVEESNILVAQNITAEKYEEIKEMTTIELDEEGISLISVNYDDTSSLKAGNKVEISIEDKIKESYPSQADASKIEVID